MKGFDSGTDQVLLIGATNRPRDLDDAARRRLTKRIYIPLPSSEARAWIVRNVLEKDGLFKLSTGDIIDSICKLTEGYSGSDMTNLVKDAAMGPLREAFNDDFKDSLQEMRPVSLDELGTYEKWNAQFGSLSTSKTVNKVKDNSIDRNRKKRKISAAGACNTSYTQTSNNLDDDCYEIPPPMDQKVAKREGEAMDSDQTTHEVDINNETNHGVDDTNEKHYKEKMEVLKSIYKALHAKNKIDENQTRLEAEKIKVKEINSLYMDTASKPSQVSLVVRQPVDLLEVTGSSPTR